MRHLARGRSELRRQPVQVNLMERDIRASDELGPYLIQSCACRAISPMKIHQHGSATVTKAVEPHRSFCGLQRNGRKSRTGDEGFRALRQGSAEFHAVTPTGPERNAEDQDQERTDHVNKPGHLKGRLQ
jgi:hypothetical protein